MRQSRDSYRGQAQQLCVSVATIAKSKDRVIPADRIGSIMNHVRRDSQDLAGAGVLITTRSCHAHLSAVECQS